MNTLTSQTDAYSLEALLHHLDAQRSSAFQLIEDHNRLLASLLGKGVASPVAVPMPIPVQPQPQPPGPVTINGPTPAAVPAPVSKGNVVSLFDYSKPTMESTTAMTDQAPAADYLIFGEFDPEARKQWGADIDALLATHGADDALAINRKHMADTIFLSASKDSLFFLKKASGILFVVCFVGPEDCYAGTLEQLKAYAESQQFQVNLMVQEDRVSVLKDSGFSTTPIGIWQRISPLSEFTLKGSSMRRLRYLVNKYAKSGDCRTVEYVPGKEPDVDRKICQVIDQWCELKGQVPPYVPGVKEQVGHGDFAGEHRFFLTWRDAVLDNVIVFSRDNFNDGYLMDLEFYSGGMPLGSTEFALSEIIHCFAAEGRQLVSLGLTMGTGLFEHENGSKDVHQLFESLRKADYVNGDANAQYKNKYRPSTTTMYLARPKDAGKRKLNDLMLLLGTG